MTWNITTRADNVRDLLKTVDEDAAPLLKSKQLNADIVDMVKTAIAQIKPKDYIQLTAYGSPDTVVINLSTHAVG